MAELHLQFVSVQRGIRERLRHERGVPTRSLRMNFVVVEYRITNRAALHDSASICSCEFVLQSIGPIAHTFERCNQIYLTLTGNLQLLHQ